MDKIRGMLRSFVNEGLASWLNQDVEDGKDNLMWGKLALADWQALKPQLTTEEVGAVEELLTQLTTLPQKVPNVADSMLDMEGVRCQRAGKLLVFYRYNSSFDLVDIIRLAYNRKEWDKII